MEQLGLGTKSTRHNIIQSLIERGYVFGSPLRPSATGIAVSETLERHANKVTSPDMTSELEKEMDSIADGEKTLQGVVDGSRANLDEIVRTMEEQKEEISSEILEGIRGDMVLGECPSCGGELYIRTARKSGKRFSGCSNYPECTLTYPLPQRGSILATGDICEECGSPKIRVITKGRKPWDLCLDPECPTKAKAKESRGESKPEGDSISTQDGEDAG
jgi:DNA topoisomerase-1